MKAHLLKLAGIAALLSVGSGCATIHSMSAGEVDKGVGRRIGAQDTGHGYFMLTIPELDAMSRLKAQCAGNLTGVQTKLSQRNWFLVVQYYRQEVSGWCQTN